MVSIVTGGQFGDEGKGKIVDYLSESMDTIVRFQGGDNAGHTVEKGNKRLKLHLIPSGVLYDKRLLIGPGMVVNPEILEREIGKLRRVGVELDGEKLGIDPKASVIMPWHIKLDELGEMNREEPIGTTKRGIGYAYEDKVSREEIRMVDLVKPEVFEEKVEKIGEEKRKRIGSLGGELEEPSLDEYLEIGERIEPYLTDVSKEICKGIDNGEEILAEGAQGTLLDLIHGTQKFVTSSSTVAGAACSYLGIGPTDVDDSLGVFKAYITRVGKGPLPTELDGAKGEKLREKGNEFGTTTGRPRRCGWLDLPLARKSVRLNSYDSIALTKLDVLTGFDKLRLCVGYKKDGRVIKDAPELTSGIEGCEPVYEELPGWDKEISDIREYGDLPRKARQYVERVGDALDSEISILSIGPKREQTIDIS